jgi:hypothetical protein
LDLDGSDRRRFLGRALEYFGRLIALAADDDMRKHEQRRIECREKRSSRQAGQTNLGTDEY